MKTSKIPLLPDSSRSRNPLRDAESHLKIASGLLPSKPEMVTLPLESDVHSYVTLDNKRKLTKQQIAYQKKLCDPRWKTRRVEILDRDNNSCVLCSNKTQLHVHHLAYTGDPWEAPNADLVTLCNVCHRKEHKIKTTLEPGFGGFYGLGHCFLHIPAALDYLARKVPHTIPTLLGLYSRVENENKFSFNWKDTPTELGLLASRLRLHIRDLVEIGAIAPDTIPKRTIRRKRHKSFHYVLCPFIYWAGSLQELEKYMISLPASHPFLLWEKVI